MGMRLRSPGREERLDRHRRWEFPGTGGSGEGGSKGTKRDIGGISFDSQAGTVCGRVGTGRSRGSGY